MKRKEKSITPTPVLLNLRFASLSNREYKVYLKRKLQLIIRDPYIKKLIEKFDKLPLSDNEWTEEIQNLHHELINKWNVSIYSKKYPWVRPDELLYKFTDPEDKYPFFILPRAEILEPVECSVFANTTSEPLKKEFIEYTYPGDRKMYFTINLNLINLNDAKYIKKTVWEYVKRYINERKKWKPMKKNPNIYNEPKELLPLYRCRDETFNNYLKWYDIHTKEKLSFRLIAHIDNTFKVNPQKASELLTELKSKKIKWGKPIKGEDKIEKGIKLIYKTIHRTDYTQKSVEPLIEEYNCPEHKNDCPTSCKYYKQWLGRFNRLMPSS